MDKKIAIRKATPCSLACKHAHPNGYYIAIFQIVHQVKDRVGNNNFESSALTLVQGGTMFYAYYQCIFCMNRVNIVVMYFTVCRHNAAVKCKRRRTHAQDM